MLFAEIGHHTSALADARRARALAVEHGMRREELVAVIGEVIARWNSELDTTVLTLIKAIRVLAVNLDVEDLLRPLTKVEVDVLWSMGRCDEARTVLQSEIERVYARLQHRTVDRSVFMVLRDASPGDAAWCSNGFD